MVSSTRRIRIANNKVFVKVAIEESMKINRADLGMLLSMPKETYHTLLSSITIIFYDAQVYEDWRQVVSKN